LVVCGVTRAVACLAGGWAREGAHRVFCALSRGPTRTTPLGPGSRGVLEPRPEGQARNRLPTIFARRAGMLKERTLYFVGSTRPSPRTVLILAWYPQVRRCRDDRGQARRPARSSGNGRCLTRKRKQTQCKLVPALSTVSMLDTESNQFHNNAAYRRRACGRQLMRQQGTPSHATRGLCGGWKISRHGPENLLGDRAG